MKLATIFSLFFFAFIGLSSTTALGKRFHYRKNNALKKNNSFVVAASSADTTKQSQENGKEESSSFMEHCPMHEISCKPSSPLYPPAATDDREDLIEVHLENTDLPNLLKWVSDTFQVNFITEDMIQPLPQGGKTVGGNKVTFQTHSPLTKQQVWDLFLTFLDLFGFGLVETSVENIYKLRPTAPNAPNTISKSPLLSYINVDWKELPDNDVYIRFVYFVRNSTLGTIQGVVDQFKSVNSLLKPLQDLNAFILTDKASNIRSIMQIVQELDQVSSPEAMSVLKLQNADAEDIVKLYENLTKAEDPGGLAARLLGTKKKPSAVYFSDTARLIAERRTNTLIILGDKESIKKIEDFIIKHVDVELKIPYSPLYVYELQYANAEDLATILTNVTKFAQTSPAAQAGGVREGDKFLQPVTFTPEKSGNRLLIKAEKEDYLKIRDIIKQLDIKQPQIAIEVLIVNVISTDNRELGIQIRNPLDQTISKNLDFQTSGLPLAAGRSQPVVNQTTGSLVANLITLAESQTPGATLLSISNVATGVWGLFKILQTKVHANVLSNPFLVTTNKYKAEISIGETRRVITTEVKSTTDANAFGDIAANLSVEITPQINSIGIINLEINIHIDTFTDANPGNANRDTKVIKTNANVGNREVLALGGLLKTNHDETMNKVPLFGDIPLIGWLFKNKTKFKEKDNLLVFISPRVIEPKPEGGLSRYSQEKASLSKDSLSEIRHPAERRDPIHRWFFKDRPYENTQYVDNFIAQQNPARCINVPESLYCPEYCDTTLLIDNQQSSTAEEKIVVASNEKMSQTTVSNQQLLDTTSTPIINNHQPKAFAVSDNVKKNHKRSLISMIVDEDKGTA